MRLKIIETNRHWTCYACDRYMESETWLVAATSDGNYMCGECLITHIQNDVLFLYEVEQLEEIGTATPTESIVVDDGSFTIDGVTVNFT